MERRSDSILLEMKEVRFMKREELDLTKVQQLPSSRYLYERYLTKLNQKVKTLQNKKKVVLNELSKEFRYIWIFMNLVPCREQAVLRRLTTMCNNLDKLRYYPMNKRGGVSWNNSVDSIIETMDNGIDLKSTDSEFIAEVVKEWGVQPSTEEDKLYMDNCIPCPETGKCKRQIWCGGVDISWWIAAKMRQKALEKSECYAQKRNARIEKERAELQTMKEMDNECPVEDEEMHEPTPITNEEEVDTTYIPARTSYRKPKTVHNPASEEKRETRSNISTALTEETQQFPKIPVRTGYKSFNVDVMETLVVIESLYKVDARKAPHLLAFIANKIFKQQWEVLDEDSGEKDTEIEVEEPETKKPKKPIGYLDNVLPSRKSIASMVENFSLLSFTDMAETIQRAHIDGKVVTYGSDDTIKAAGNKRFDVKTTHVTVIDQEHKRETFTSGFYTNTSHKGIDAAKTIRHDIAKMAVVTGISYDEMQGYIDFFMNDRAGDGELMLNELNVEHSKRLKCNAHILLAVDNAIDKVFKDVETHVGVSKLISNGASHCFNSPKNSVWYLGLIALSKLLSPSHNTESISLHSDYMKFLQDDKGNHESDTAVLSASLLKKGFKGFQSNRFGRLGEISAAVLKHKPLIDTLFEELVDENANKLVLAVMCFKMSRWYLLCCEVANHFYDTVIVPLKQLIGIDEFKDTTNPNRSWEGIKAFFKELLTQLKNTETVDHSAKSTLIAKCSKKVHESIANQLKLSEFFKDDSSAPYNTDMKLAPLTNLGCEAEFAHLDNDCKRAGGSTSLETLSQKHIIARNSLFKKERWKKLSVKEKRAKWKWAKGSAEAKKIKAMETKFNEGAKSVQKLAIEAKKEKKKQRKQKLLKNLEICKLHGGPLTPNDIGKLGDLSYEQIKAEAGFLKKTTAPNIRFKRKVGAKFLNFSEEELKQQVGDALKPCNNQVFNMEELVLAAIGDVHMSPPTESEPEPPTPVGSVGWWLGPLKEEMIGIVLDKTTLQLYETTRHGFCPYDVPVELTEWRLLEEIKEYHYEQKGPKIFLIV